ncbi:MAG: 2-dehydropantoate 2-reductase [Thermoplasmatota archaeon]
MMKIMVFGAGAIGSLFGGLLSTKNEVLLFGRKNQMTAIQNNGLFITGKTTLHTNLDTAFCIDDVSFVPDVLLLTVKSFDTKEAIQQTLSLIGKDTLVVSFQNGLGNIDILKEYVSEDQIAAGITTHGSLYVKPGVIKHTGRGNTCFGELSGEKTSRIQHVVESCNAVGIKTSVSNHIVEDIVKKAIINASINPLTAFFRYPNGYLLQNPVLAHLVEKICLESTAIAQAQGFDLSSSDMIDETRQVIEKTSENHSSMFQSVQKKSKTEIDSINAKFVELGRKKGCDVFLNQVLTKLIHSIYDS